MALSGAPRNRVMVRNWTWLDRRPIANSLIDTTFWPYHRLSGRLACARAGEARRCPVSRGLESDTRIPDNGSPHHGERRHTSPVHCRLRADRFAIFLRAAPCMAKAWALHSKETPADISTPAVFPVRSISRSYLACYRSPSRPNPTNLIEIVSA